MLAFDRRFYARDQKDPSFRRIGLQILSNSDEIVVCDAQNVVAFACSPIDKRPGIVADE